MIFKKIASLGLFLIILILGGCAWDIPYNPDLFKANPDNCWPCVMYQQAFKAIDGVLDNSLAIVAENSFELMKVALIFWLLMRIGRVVVSLKQPNLKKEISDFAVMSGKVLMVTILLKNPEYFYDLFGGVILQPIGQGFLEMSGVVLQAPAQAGINDITSPYLDGHLKALIQMWIDLFSGTGSTAPTETIQNSHMFGELAMKVQEIVFQIYDAMWRGVGLGFQLLISADFSAFLAALLLIAGLCYLLLRVPLTFVDAFVRIGLVMLTMPLLLVGWLFSYPRDILKKVIHTFFAGFFDILFTCIYVVFLVSLFRVYESQELPHLFSTAYQTSEGGMRTTGTGFSTDFTILTVLTWSMLMLAGKVQDFSNFFFEGAEKSSMANLINKGISLAWRGIKIGAQAVSGQYASVAQGMKDIGQDLMSPADQPNNENKQE